MNVTTVLNALMIISEEGPALGDLVNRVKDLFTPAQQADLQQAYLVAVKASDHDFEHTDRVLKGDGA